MEESADVRVGFERIQKVRVTDARLDGAEPDAVSGRFQCGDRSGEFREPTPRIVVEAEVASGEHQFAEAGIEVGAGAGEHIGERDGDRRAAERGDDAEGTTPRTSILHLQVGAGEAERE